jgi:hypothetical protein
MRFTVVWLPKAEASLANLWMKSSNRREISDACNRLDASLKNDPEAKGTPSGKFFKLEDTPLSVLYHVDPADLMVRVIAVKQIGQ